ncbi:hypothetical protein [Clostridium grantii]|uniref:SdpI/YhfL protein family protein n=1 Tax=Clostridium grantii DSM 8605 TaxID=1121316 RepID=A0A1M5RH82_9CLOT|nr:hypothetical protein [Clostridium grantii]SHH25568.1 hypothetical protein SAMN02745207_00528 [Clostridium grantii DSM 8605]
MNVTSLSLAYFFLGLFFVSIIFSFYFKILFIRTNPGNTHRDKIIGSMKDPISWRSRNNRTAYISMFWAFVSLAVFVYLKFFHKAGLINIIYVFAYVALAALSIIFLGKLKKEVKQK